MQQCSEIRQLCFRSQEGVSECVTVDSLSPSPSLSLSVCLSVCLSACVQSSLVVMTLDKSNNSKAPATTEYDNASIYPLPRRHGHHGPSPRISPPLLARGSPLLGPHTTVQRRIALTMSSSYPALAAQLGDRGHWWSMLMLIRWLWRTRRSNS